MKQGRRGFGVKCKYAFDNFMSKGGFSVFTALILLFAGAFVLMSVVRFVANCIIPDAEMAKLNDMFWRVFLQVVDGGAIGEDSGGNVLNKVVGVGTVFLGLILFSSLVAFITSQFEAKLDDLRKGRSEVIEKKHTLILGFGDRVLEIIRELTIANESEKSPAVVVLAEKEKDEMDEFFRERIEDLKTTRIVTRSGSTSSIQMLSRVSASEAKSVIILNNAQVDASAEEKALADARVLKTILAVIASTGEENCPPIIAEIHEQSKRELAQNLSSRISIIDEHSILAKLMVQTSRISGLAHVYDTLVGFEGCEFYYHRPPQGLAGMKYEDLLFHYPTCSVLGVRNAAGEIHLNPPPGTGLNDTDEAILLAEDDSTIKYSKTRIETKVPAGEPAPQQSKIVENQLIVGWSKKAPVIVDEYSKYLVEGSSIDVVVDDIDDEMRKEFGDIQARHAAIKIRLIKANFHNQDVMQKLKPDHYDNVIILTGDGGNAELRDSETIADLLEFRRYFKSLGSAGTKTQLITEVADSDNIELIEEAGVQDFLISNQFVSKIYAQASEEPNVLKVYDDLFSPEGSEVYIKPVSLFMSQLPGKVSFADLCAAALRRNETCFGVRLRDEETDHEKNYGIYINPEKGRVFDLKQGDWLITLAEDEL